MQVSDLLNQYKDEQKYVKEFLNIIDNANIKNESDSEEKDKRWDVMKWKIKRSPTQIIIQFKIV